jgi:hypothetical protein
MKKKNKKKGFHHMATEFACPHWMATKIDLVIIIKWRQKPLQSP